jgi:hypothetical protein
LISWNGCFNGISRRFPRPWRHFAAGQGRTDSNPARPNTCAILGTGPWSCNFPRVETRGLRGATARILYRRSSPKRKSSAFKRSSTSLRSPLCSRTCARSIVRNAERRLSRVLLLSMELEQSLCLQCARLDDLEFLPSGDAAVTRRASKYSGRVAVVVRFSQDSRQARSPGRDE